MNSIVGLRPWVRVYRGRCLEMRFGALGLQGGFTLPHVSIVLWRNSDCKELFAWRWGRWLA